MSAATRCHGLLVHRLSSERQSLQERDLEMPHDQVPAALVYLQPVNVAPEENEEIVSWLLENYDLEETIEKINGMAGCY